MTSWTDVLGWTLIHFVWQGALLTAVAAGLLRLCRSRSANARYGIACVVLAVMLVMPFVTAVALWSPAGETGSAITPGPAVFTTVERSTAAAATGMPGASFVLTVRSGLDALTPWVVVTWFTGVAVLLLRMAGGLWRVRRLHRRALVAAVSRWHAVAERIGAQLGLRRPVRVVESSRVESPIALGWLRPVIVLPVAAAANLTPSQVEAILVHELVHIRRHDYVVNIVQTLAETLLFYHPGVWWVSNQVRVEREHCCDDAAVAACGNPADYARALGELEAWRSAGTPLALAAASGSVSDRVRRVLRGPLTREPRSVSWTVGLIAIVLVMAGVNGAFQPFGPSQSANASAQETAPSPDAFDWQLRPTDHFDLYYDPALEDGLGTMTVVAEHAYDHISGVLSYQLSQRVPVFVYKTRADYEQQQLVPAVPPEVLRETASFSEPLQNRIVFLADEDPDRWYWQIAHELTHIFAFDIIPRSAANASRVPVWMDEGLADYMAGTWLSEDLAALRDVVTSDRVPSMSNLSVAHDTRNRLPYSLGHAFFDFIEARYGVERIKQFLVELRRDVVDGTDDLYQAAFHLTPDEIDLAFEEYMKARFAS